MDDKRYWTARRSMRISPITGSNDLELWNSLTEFFSNKMKIPSGTIMSKDVESVKKIPHEQEI